MGPKAKAPARSFGGKGAKGPNAKKPTTNGNSANTSGSPASPTDSSTKTSDAEEVGTPTTPDSEAQPTADEAPVESTNEADEKTPEVKSLEEEEPVSEQSESVGVREGEASGQQEDPEAVNEGEEVKEEQEETSEAKTVDPETNQENSSQPDEEVASPKEEVAAVKEEEGTREEKREDPQNETQAATVPPTTQKVATENVEVTALTKESASVVEVKKEVLSRSPSPNGEGLPECRQRVHVDPNQAIAMTAAFTQKNFNRAAVPLHTTLKDAHATHVDVKESIAKGRQQLDMMNNQLGNVEATFSKLPKYTEKLVKMKKNMVTIDANIKKLRQQAMDIKTEVDQVMGTKLHPVNKR